MKITELSGKVANCHSKDIDFQVFAYAGGADERSTLRDMLPNADIQWEKNNTTLGDFLPKTWDGTFSKVPCYVFKDTERDCIFKVLS
ncbi:MAG: hypothetical protein WAV73_04645 [Candidatus Moraniibacteriota bacterium]